MEEKEASYSKSSDKVDTPPRKSGNCDIAVKICGISVKYRKTEVLSNICLDIRRGEYLAIIGPNGGGKTTLLKTVLGLIKPSGGEIEILGKKGTGNASKIGYVPQFAAMDRRFPISVLETVMTAFLKGGMHPLRVFTDNDRKKAITFLARVGIDELADKQISELSGGEFQRLLIARALAADPEILLLDEPTASVDPASRNNIYSLLNSLHQQGMTVVMVTHDLMAVSSSVGRIACLNRTLVYHGEPKLTEEVCTAMYGCPVDLIAHGVPHRVLDSHSHLHDCDGGCHHD